MEEKELLLKEIKGIIADSQKDNVTKADIDARLDVVNKRIEESLNDTQVKELKENVAQMTVSIAELSGTIKAIKEVADTKKSEAPKTFREAVKEAIMANKDQVLTERNDEYGERFSLKEYFEKTGNRSTPEFQIKTAVDMLQSNISQSNINTVRNTEIAGFVGIPLNLYPHVLDWMPIRNIKKGYMSMIVAYSYEDGAATKDEGSASGKTSFLLKTVEFKAFYVATHIILSDETLDDLDEVLDEIARIAPDRVNLKLDEYILGSTGNDTTAIKGILGAGKNTAFASATTYADYFANANEISVIQGMKLQAEAAGYMPDTVIISPAMVARIADKKNELSDSISDRRVVFGAIGEPTFICGMAVRKSTKVDDDAVIVADSKQLLIGLRQGMSMEIGRDGTDLTEGQKTAVIKIRAAFGVGAAEAVVYTADIDTAMSDINLDTTAG
jgi:hypothetical protein